MNSNSGIVTQSPDTVRRRCGMKRNAPGESARFPPLKTPPIRTMNLYGRAPKDGRLVLWKRAAQVVPVNAFERDGRWIKSGHYVIDYNGDAVAVHCGNTTNGGVSVQLMHDELVPYTVDRGTIESMLLGKMVVSEEQQALVSEGKRLNYFFRQAPDAVGTRMYQWRWFLEVSKGTQPRQSAKYFPDFEALLLRLSELRAVLSAADRVHVHSSATQTQRSVIKSNGAVLS
jgi:hypothetical protein